MITRFVVDFQTNNRKISKEFTYADDAACYALGLLRDIKNGEKLSALTLAKVEYRSLKKRLFGSFEQKTGLWNFWYSNERELELLAKGETKALTAFEL